MEDQATKKNQPYSIVLTRDDQETIERIKDLTGLINTSDVIRQSLRNYHNQLEPMYVRAKGAAEPRQKYANPEERVAANMKKKKEEDAVKKALQEEHALGVCNVLGGEIVDQGGGMMACKFNLYEKVGKRVMKGSQTIPFEKLDELWIERQYKGGSKEEIEQLLNSI